MTLRRLKVLILALPASAAFWAEYGAAQEKAVSESKVTRLRERQAFYDKQKRLREEPA